jgi:hypothetical protein
MLLAVAKSCSTARQQERLRWRRLLPAAGKNASSPRRAERAQTAVTTAAFVAVPSHASRLAAVHQFFVRKLLPSLGLGGGVGFGGGLWLGVWCYVVCEATVALPSTVTRCKAERLCTRRAWSSARTAAQAA